jgi:outer membrane protein OmpA-like peptidoglycan-associated protein
MKLTEFAIAALLLSQGYAFAQEVKMYTDSTPSAEEMANILFGDVPTQAKPKIKTRSINFSKKPAALPSPQAALQQAKAASIGLPIRFGYNSTEILPESYASLDEVGKMLQMEQLRNEKLLIEGHTDASGSDTYNRYLSEKRALAVKNYLISRFNIEPHRLLVSGKGESDPLPGIPAYSAQNRRVQFYRAP